jgi:hypothetical protein
MKFIIEVDEVIAEPYVNLAGQLKATAEALMARAIEMESVKLRQVCQIVSDVEDVIDAPKKFGASVGKLSPTTKEFARRMRKSAERARKTPGLVGPCEPRV